MESNKLNKLYENKLVRIFLIMFIISLILNLTLAWLKGQVEILGILGAAFFNPLIAIFAGYFIITMKNINKKDRFSQPKAESPYGYIYFMFAFQTIGLIMIYLLEEGKLS